MKLPFVTFESKLAVRQSHTVTQVPQTFDSTRMDRDSYSGGSGGRATRTLTLRLYIMHEGPDVAEDVVISINVPGPLTLEEVGFDREI